ncbi:MazG-like nucleotide pyrophosphohydrolase family protein [Dermacoccus sp. SAI-028]|uniref:MazG nucleotide pyrophosphohydrolase domain-containing protein n=1 Tax=Dermacoccus sp. SAI-028 TaxID=2768432 RepID=UPI0010456A5D|nr:MazG nucleotide pyrophosphohydrolase domain-containing protein [Dermacoccus sp. SAI-028]TCJ90794.1 MazG-like nucleotide pyrophosphohydrolase family protein [Dermacoccus sp. SAI-028]
MELNEWSGRIEGISAAYGEYFAVERTPEWVLLELTEEVGELTQAYLASSGQGRNRGKSDDELRQDLEGEVADAFAMILVFARSAGIDIESALTTKWLPWEKFHADRAAGLAPEPLAHRWPEPSDDDPQASS